MMDTFWPRRGREAQSSRAIRIQRSAGPTATRPSLARPGPPETPDYLQVLLASRYLMVAVKDLDGRYVEVNKAYARAMGLEVDAVRGRLDRDLIPPDVSGDLAQRERMAMRGVAIEPELESFSREAPSLLVERLPIRDADGELRALCLIAMKSPISAAPQAVVGEAPATAVAEVASQPADPSAGRDSRAGRRGGELAVLEDERPGGDGQPDGT